MAKNEMSTRQAEGLVEEDFEQQPRDEVVEAGEHLAYDYGEVVLSEPSAKANPYMSEEEQSMEMTPQIVGPPAYGSPDPTTSQGRLLSLRDHPLRAESLPEGHPAAISEDYGKDHEGATHMPGESSFPVVPQTDLEQDLQGRRDAREGNYEEMTKAELLDEAQARGLNVASSWKKDEIVDALEASDADAESDENAE